MLQKILEELFEFAAKLIPSEKILEAKKSYQKETGEIYEDDKSYNSRMALFLEWYLFDTYIEDESKTVLENLLDQNSEEWGNDQLKTYKSITESIQALYLVKKVKDDNVKVLNLFTDEIYLVNEKDSRLIFRKNDIFQGRIIYFQQQFQFTGNFCFHPEKTHRYIKPEIKIISKTQIKYKKDLAKLEKLLAKENKKITGQDTQIEKVKEKIKNSDSESKTTKLNQSLAQLIEEKGRLLNNTEDLEKSIFVLKHDKIKVEGNKQINKLINKLAYMNLKWERSRQIEISDIYKN